MAGHAPGTSSRRTYFVRVPSSGEPETAWNSAPVKEFIEPRGGLDEYRASAPYVSVAHWPFES